jgi:hypothetical protein
MFLQSSRRNMAKVITDNSKASLRPRSVSVQPVAPNGDICGDGNDNDELPDEVRNEARPAGKAFGSLGVSGAMATGRTKLAGNLHNEKEDIMPFVPALVEAAVGIGEAVAGAASAAGAAAEVGGEAAAVGAETAEAGEVGGNMASMARNAVDIGKQVYNGANRVDDIGKIFNNNSPGNNNSSGGTGAPGLSGVIDSMSGAASLGASDPPFQSHEGTADFPTLANAIEPAPLSVANAFDADDDFGHMSQISSGQGSGSLRI